MTHENLLTNLMDEKNKNNEFGDYYRGLSQNPDTKVDYYCEKCGSKYKYIDSNNRENGLITAIWKDGPSCYSNMEMNIRGKYVKSFYSLLNEITHESYGVSRNPNTKYFILVLQLKYYCEHCGKRYSNRFEIDNKSCRQITRIKINEILNCIVFEWIPYNQFNNIEKIGKNDFSTVYSAIWKDGLLNFGYNVYKRNPNTKVALKCIYISQIS
ncbi:hypothetical protein RclHR1_08390008 [Rhizophagus clarus]|uniref:Protein kinase domain-containing protein n=1 Tax=Rhizophagus clarus TaxID=94130 RepID=A0A2Z6S0V1_9GLOM|nr:hypothetical protein RclHR1_08390008 [Rhizophagus clarus]